VLEGAATSVLLGDVARVESRSPDVCAPEAGETQAWFHAVFGDGVTLIRTLSAGSCELEAALGERRARATIAVVPRAGAPAPSLVIQSGR
jgi:hypothetical protein